ncbi:MAG: hypothetical protein ACJ790_22730 [Myxococcaceae bacterium]
MSRRITIAAVGMALAFSACAGLRHATEADLPRAHVKFPNATLSSLNEGRQIYAARCSGCHTLFLPESRTAPEWNDMVDEMAKDAHLSANDRALIEQYLVTFAQAETGAGSATAKADAR